MEFVAGFFFWILFSFVVAGAASGRGRSWGDWAFAALFLSPLVAGVILMAMPDLAEQKRREEREAEAEAEDSRMQEKREQKELARRAEERREEERRGEARRQAQEAAKIIGADLVVSREQLRKLHAQEVLSEVEFGARKQQAIAGLKNKILSEPPEAFLTALLPLRKNETLTAQEMAQIKDIVFGHSAPPRVVVNADPPPRRSS